MKWQTWVFAFFASIFFTSCPNEEKMANEGLNLALKLFCKNQPITRAPVCCVIFPVHVIGAVHVIGCWFSWLIKCYFGKVHFQSRVCLVVNKNNLREPIFVCYSVVMYILQFTWNLILLEMLYAGTINGYIINYISRGTNFNTSISAMLCLTFCLFF